MLPSTDDKEMYMKLIRDAYGRICVLGDQCDEPTPEWKSIQRKPCTDNPTWHSAYPLTGGAVNVQEGTYTVVGDVHADQIRVHFEECRKGGPGIFNPASETVLRLWEREQGR